VHAGRGLQALVLCAKTDGQPPQGLGQLPDVVTAGAERRTSHRPFPTATADSPHATRKLSTASPRLTCLSGINVQIPNVL
jgi:hypothetical protein